MIDNETRLERLTELQGMLTHHDQLFTKKKVRFDIRNWAKLDYFDSETECGTAACALGSAALYEPFAKAGLCLSGGESGSPVCDSYEGYSAGAEFFGITPDESLFLFSPGAYGDRSHEYPTAPELNAIYGFMEPVRNVTPEHVAARVGKLIEKYKEK